jgi:hypothetical protein
MRATEIQHWLDSYVKATGGDPFDKEVAGHIVRVFGMIERRAQKGEFNNANDAFSFFDALSREVMQNTVKLLLSRSLVSVVPVASAIGLNGVTEPSA